MKKEAHTATCLQSPMENMRIPDIRNWLDNMQAEVDEGLAELRSYKEKEKNGKKLTLHEETRAKWLFGRIDDLRCTIAWKEEQLKRYYDHIKWEKQHEEEVNKKRRR